MMTTTEHDERLAVLIDELTAAVAHDDPTDVDGSKLASIASAAAWAHQLAQAGRRAADHKRFRESTGASWLAARAACGDCPRRAAVAWARDVLAQVTGKTA